MMIIQLLVLVLLMVAPPKERTREVTEKKNEEKLTYHVLVSDRQTKHGPYRQTYLNNVLVEGEFRYGKKEGLWTTWFPGIRQVDSRGHYQADLKEGPWEYYRKGSFGDKSTLHMAGNYLQGQQVGEWNSYDDNGSLCQTIDKSMNKLIYSRDPLPSMIQVPTGPLEVKVLEGQPPVYPGNKAVFYHLMHHVQYPKEAREKGEAGRVIVRFLIDEQGNAHSHTIALSVSPSLDQEALRVLKLISTGWVPAHADEKPVEAVLFQPVIFKIGS